LKYLLLLPLLTACINSTPNLASNSTKLTQASRVSIDLGQDQITASANSLSINTQSSVLDFTQLPYLEISSQVVQITNTSATALPISSIVATDSSGVFSVQIDHCPPSLAQNQSCQVTVSANTTGLYDATYSGTLTITSGQFSDILNLSVTSSGNPSPYVPGQVPNLVITQDSPFLTLSSGTDLRPYRQITIKNIGTGAASNLNFNVNQLLSGTSDMSVLVNHCPTLLLPNKSCDILVLFTNYLTSTTIASTDNASIAYTAPDNTNLMDVLNVAQGADANSCPTGTSFISDGQCANNTVACSINNGNGIQSLIPDGSGNYGACQFQSCPSNLKLMPDGQSCGITCTNGIALITFPGTQCPTDPHVFWRPVNS